jgi:maleate isomerase
VLATDTNSSHRATVLICVGFDAMALWIARGARGARALSRGEFGGRVGSWRLLDLLDRHSVTSTWFVPGHTAETFPEVTREVVARGHEVANHGYMHEDFERLTFDEIQSVVRRGADALEGVTGQRSVGMRAPVGDFDGRLFEFLVSEGYEYDSSMWDGEYSLYWARGLDTVPDDGPVKFGSPVDLVEVPLSLMMQDFVYLEADLGQMGLNGRNTPRQVEEIWREQFDYMYEREPGGVLNVTIHPQTIGRGSRAAMLERFLEYCASRPGTRFTTCAAVAREFRALGKGQNGPPSRQGESSGSRVSPWTPVGRGHGAARENGIAWGPRLKLGHITPSCNSVLETMTVSMSAAVADRVSHHFTRIPVTNISLSEEDLSQFAVEPMLNAARLLADARTDVILWNGTSGAWTGLEADEEICHRIEAELGVPASTSTLAQIEAMTEYGLLRYGLAVPYTTDVAERMVEIFAAHGVTCVGLATAGRSGGAEMADLTPDAVCDLIRAADHPDAECIVLSCTGVAGAQLVDRMERELGKPILDTIAVTLWKGLRLVGIDEPLHGWGALLDGRLQERPNAITRPAVGS